jgi:hypothetical protein
LLCSGKEITDERAERGLAGWLRCKQKTDWFVLPATRSVADFNLELGNPQEASDHLLKALKPNP